MKQDGWNADNHQNWVISILCMFENDADRKLCGEFLCMAVRGQNTLKPTWGVQTFRLLCAFISVCMFAFSATKIILTWTILGGFIYLSIDGQGGLACCNSWGRKESDTTERLNWTDVPIYHLLDQLNQPLMGGGGEGSMFTHILRYPDDSNV